MLSSLVLLPKPRRVADGTGSWRFSPAQRRAILRLEPERAGAIVRVDPRQMPVPQSYRLILDPWGVLVLAHDAAAAQYAAVTLRQLARQCPNSLPCGRIDDAPDFAFRGYMLDISRDKVPTMATLYRIADLLVELKLNQFQLYTEHTFAYRGHRRVWEHASPMTASEIRKLDAYCRARHIELVPNQNCFGHMERWLKHEPYRRLAEAPKGYQTPWGFRQKPSTLAPHLPGSIRLVRDLLNQLLPLFSSHQANVGCDETWDLGQGQSKALCDQLGKGRVYLDYLRKVQKIVASHGKTMQFWGDVVLLHPERVPHLPPQAIALVWGYEADHPFARQVAQLAASGVPFYVCPGTSTWNSLAGRTDNALANLRRAAQEGLRHGAIGYLITDWGDNGHMQPLGASFVPLAYGAALGWCAENNRAIGLPRAVDLHVFEDAAGVMGQLALDLGNAYQVAQSKVANASTLAMPFYLDPRQIPPWLKQASSRPFQAARRHVEKTSARLKKTRMRCADGPGLVREFALAAKMLRLGAAIHAARCGVKDRSLAGLLPQVRQALARELRSICREYPRIWRRRNRPGGLTDSLGRLQTLQTALAGSVFRNERPQKRRYNHA